MILIADSGSTKTTWSWNTPDGGWKRYWSDGMNPLTSSEGQMGEILRLLKEEMGNGTQGPGEVHFYGAGCGTSGAKEVVGRLLREWFGEAEIEVQTDLMGACRALWDRDGEAMQIVGILGTGSNACLFDGEEIVENPASLGYLLGDEGSGNHIGKRLLKDFVRGKMPEELATLFGSGYELNYSSVIEHLYHQPNANRYLAQFTLFAAQHREHGYIHGLLEDVFEEFFDNMIRPIAKETQRVALMGSVAVQFEEEIVAVGERMGLSVVRFMKEPMEGMVSFHLGR